MIDMHRARRPLTIARLMAIVAAIGLGAGVLRAGTETAYKITYTVTIFGMIAAAIAARDRGPFWYGFAIAGWIYFLVGFNPPTVLPGVGLGGARLVYPQHRQLNPALLSSLYLHDLCVFLIEEPREPPTDPAASIRQINQQSGRYSRVKSAWDARIGNTVGIGHSLLTILIATIGGWLALVLARSRR